MIVQKNATAYPKKVLICFSHFYYFATKEKIYAVYLNYLNVPWRWALIFYYFGQWTSWFWYSYCAYSIYLKICLNFYNSKDPHIFCFHIVIGWLLWKIRKICLNYGYSLKTYILNSLNSPIKPPFYYSFIINSLSTHVSQKSYTGCPKISVTSYFSNGGSK